MYIEPITSNLFPVNNIFNVINGTAPASVPDVFSVINSFKIQKYTSPDDIKYDPAYVNFYLQVGNRRLIDLAEEIIDTTGAKTDDEKVQAIQAWVVYNIEYTEDRDQWGYDELWQPPTVTIQTRKGDCEDGAFLIMSLALNAGVDPDRLRFYGGSVKAGAGSATGGHGWIAYRREFDDEWVVADYSYLPDLSRMENRVLMKDDMNYIEQWFMMEVGEVITSDKNRVREPNVSYNSNGYMQPNVLLPGTWMSQYA